MFGRRSSPVVVHRITRAPGSHAADLDRRIFRYLLSMAIRTACILLVFVIHHPVRWGFAAAAVVLPYVAVVLANATDHRRPSPDAVPIVPRALAATAERTPIDDH